MRKGIWGFALVAIVLLMASCSSESEYANAIPKDASMVMSFDFKTMAEKSGINGKGGEKVVAKLTDALKSGLEGEAYKTAEKIIQNPSESGLSFTFFNWTKSPVILPGLLDFFSDKRIPPLFLSRALNFHTKQLYHFLPVNTRKRKRKVCEQSWKL